MKKWADAYLKRAMQRGDIHGAMRAANFMTTLHVRAMGGDVSPYNDFDDF